MAAHQVMKPAADPAHEGIPAAVRRQPLFHLGLLTIAAVAIHGYHFGADDSAVYLPAVLKFIHPHLYPFGAEFFMAHARLSQFAFIVAMTARLSRAAGIQISDQWIIFLWYLAATFAFLLAAWQLAVLCFQSPRARWSAVALIATLLTVPAAGTALVLMDPYLTARSASTPFTLFAIAAFLAGRPRLAILWIVLTAIVHPQMAVLAAGFLVILAIPSRWTDPLFKPRAKIPTAGGAFIGFNFAPATPEYRQTLDMRSFLFITRWTWFEWLGAAIPLAVLFLFGRLTSGAVTPAFTRLSRALTIFGVAATSSAILISATPALESFVRLQPMRAFHLLYIFFFLFLGGLLGEYALKSREWLGVGIFGVLALGMFLLQLNNYPNSRHIEWPDARPLNSWVAAFEWIRSNTPTSAVFALDPNYIQLPGEDEHGFRAIAQRSVLADRIKDSGVVSLFPQLAPEWAKQQRAQQGWQHFQREDFERLAQQYPVTWVVLAGNSTVGLECPYRNHAVAVCKIPNAPGLR